MEPLISVIVPVYKVEAYLPRCLDSICGQTYHNLEILLVDDGSPDRCGEICDQYAARDSRIRVLHKQNGGPSDARNAALDIASGQYVVFVDSDDRIDMYLFETVMELHPFQAAVYGFTKISEEGRVIEVIPACDCSKLISFHDHPDLVEQLLKTSLLGYACNKIYNIDAIGKTRFKSIPQQEDMVFNLEIMRSLSSISLSPSCGYYYLIRNTSLLRGRYSGKIPVIDTALHEMTSVHPDLCISMNRKCANHILKTYLLDCMQKYIFTNSFPSLQQKKEYIRQLFANEEIRNVIQYSSSEPKLFRFFSICYKFNLPMVFFHTMARRWSNA